MLPHSQIETPTVLPPTEPPNVADFNAQRPNQVPLVVLFELTAVVAVACAFAPVIGWMSAGMLSLMAMLIVARCGLLATVAFGLALLWVELESQPESFVLCIVTGFLIAAWPIVHAIVVSQWRYATRNA